MCVFSMSDDELRDIRYLLTGVHTTLLLIFPLLMLQFDSTFYLLYCRDFQNSYKDNRHDCIDQTITIVLCSRAFLNMRSCKKLRDPVNGDQTISSLLSSIQQFFCITRFEPLPLYSVLCNLY